MAITGILIYFPLRCLFRLRPRNKKEKLKKEILSYFNSDIKEKLVYGEYGKTFAMIKTLNSHEILKNTIGYSKIKAFYVDIEIDKLIEEGILESISGEPPTFALKKEMDQLEWQPVEMIGKC